MTDQGKQDLKNLYNDASATTSYWNQSWASRNYEAMVKFELGSFSHRATVDKLVTQCQIRDGDHVLDVGCGWGRIIIGMLRQVPGIHVHGVDVSAEAIRRCAVFVSRYTGQVADLRVASAESLPFADNSFDEVVSSRVWQYITNPRHAMRETCRVLRPSGRATVMVPNARNPVRARTYHTQLLKVEQVAEWMEHAGLSVIGQGSIVFAPPKKMRFSDRSLWVQIERVLERTPGINRIGGLAWVTGERPIASRRSTNM